MSKTLICVVDESGSNNLPGPESEDDFCFGAVICEESSLPGINALVTSLEEILQNKSFKYKHLVRSKEARAAFLRAMRDPKLDFKIWGFYVAGGCLLREAERSERAVVQLGSGDGEIQRARVREIMKDPRPALLESFLQFGALCVARYAHGISATIDMHLDPRTDGGAFKLIVDEHLDLFKSARRDWKETASSLRFHTDMPPHLRKAAKLADVIAGDIRNHFRRHADRVDRCLIPSGLLKDFPAAAIKYYNEHGDFPVERVQDPLSDPVSEDPTDATPLLQGYWRRLLKSLISYGSRDGIMTHIKVEHGSNWVVFQLPD